MLPSGPTTAKSMISMIPRVSSLVVAAALGLLAFGRAGRIAPASLDAGQATAAPAARSAPPRQVKTGGPMGSLTRLADGRLLTAYPKIRPGERWKDVSIPQAVYGRFSTDHGEHWSAPQLFVTEPAVPGTTPGVLPRGTSDGSIQLIGRRYVG